MPSVSASASVSFSTSSFPEILTTCRFFLQLEIRGSMDPFDAYFMECKGFKRTQEVIEVCEVTPQPWGKGNNRGAVVRTKVPGNIKCNNVTLKRGLSCSKTLWQWFDEVQKGKWADPEKGRRDITLTIYDQAAKPQARFICTNAWISSYAISDLNAASNEIEVEELELACEDFTREG